MSRFTDKEHLELIIEANKWIDHLPETTGEHCAYADLQLRLKDYSKAVYHYGVAFRRGFVPAGYGLLLCRKEKVVVPEWSAAMEQAVFHYYEERQNTTEEEKYRLAMCLAYGIGTGKRPREALQMFSVLAEHNGAAMFELGRAYANGGLACEKNRERAMCWYEKSYLALYEPAIFAHFALYDGAFADYWLKREIIEGYSFRMGQLMRVATVSPCRDSYRRVAEMYEHGFPGDVGDEDARYKKKALPFRKKEAQMKEEYNYGVFVTFPESQIFKNVICKRNMDFFNQASFLENNI